MDITALRILGKFKHWWNRKKSEFDGKVKSFKFKARKSWGIPAGRDLRESYLLYVAMTKDAAQRRSWTFYEAIKHCESSGWKDRRYSGYSCLISFHQLFIFWPNKFSIKIYLFKSIRWKRRKNIFRN
jgi:hypothetical protein